MLNDSQMKPINNLVLADYPNFCYWDGSITRTKMLSMIWSSAKNREVKILDIGCGLAKMWVPFLKNMENVTLYGFDPSEKAIYEANKLHVGLGSKFNVGNIQVTNLDSNLEGQFDFITSHSVLEHVVQRHLFFETVSNYLNESGIALISWGKDHFNQGIKTDIRNWASELLAFLGIEKFYAKKVCLDWATGAIDDSNLELLMFLQHSLVPMKQLIKFSEGKDKAEIFQHWISIEEILNKGNNYREDFSDKLDETLTLIVKKNF